MARKAKEEAEHAVEEAEKEAEQAKQRAVAKKAKEAKRLADELYESQQKLMQVRGAFAVACPLLPRSLSPNGHLLSCSLPPSPFHHPLASTLLPSCRPTSRSTRAAPRCFSTASSRITPLACNRPWPSNRPGPLTPD